ncbi:polysaccharide biosynthesis/export family protein [Vulgatibacter incomptus]|uniref:Capsule polysaccharide export protein n=1 Tax=Vulgatibacter incomptus TaxID=1391653 RepID=A0A0K1P8J7_9BACT|nr:polysaccharide biosynthesis/export family protein [Vulgatibacter incomptus]AKU89845.1 Capsule polysaccharide export protein [Vulgatibacter incomptus]
MSSGVHVRTSRGAGTFLRTAPGFVALIACLAWGVLGCASTSPYKWVDDIPGGRDDPAVYRLGVRDVISVRVWNQESMSVERARVREDGRISLPFLKDVRVAGLTPNELGDRLQTELVSFIVDPVVTVTLDEPAALDVSVVGEVTTTGVYAIHNPAGVLHAIAAAGGLTQFADRDSIFVLRRLSPAIPPTRIRFRYRDLTSGGTRAADFLLQSGDVVVVE